MMTDVTWACVNSVIKALDPASEPVLESRCHLYVSLLVSGRWRLSEIAPMRQKTKRGSARRQILLLLIRVCDLIHLNGLS